LSVGPRTILIDGYNVIRNTPGLAAAERVSLQAGRAALLAQIVARYRHTPHTAVVVFDGNGSIETTTALAKGVRGQVVFTCCGESADMVITRIAARERACGAEVVVVSDDIEVRAGVGTIGGQAAHVAQLQARLNAPAKYQLRMARHRAHVRRELEGQEAEPPQQRQSGNPHRSSRKQRRDQPENLL
jgi:uncharacterized protein